MTKPSSSKPRLRRVQRSQASGTASHRSPSFWRRHSRTLTTALAALVAAGVVFFVVPRLVGLGPTLRRLRSGDGWWLALGVALEAFSYFGAIVLFHGVFARSGSPIGWRSSYQITMAGTAATKLLAAAGAGGIALMVWALRGFGLSGPEVADGMVCYEILTYAVYMAAMAIAGLGLWFGVFAGPAPIGVSLIPAIFAIAVIAAVLSCCSRTGRSRGSCCGARSGQAGKHRSGGAGLPRCRDRFVPGCWRPSEC